LAVYGFGKLLLSGSLDVEAVAAGPVKWVPSYGSALMSVVTLRTTLSESDLRLLVKGTTDDDRAYAAHKVARAIDYAELTPEERRNAEDIIRFIANDAAALVRRSLATALKSSPKLPPDVAKRMAADVDSIALPILQHSPSLSDSDLVEVLRAAGPARQMAIASREKLSEAVTDALVETATAPAVAKALANDNAAFSPGGLTKVLDRMGDQSQITAAMAHRRTLPVAIVEKLVAMVSGEVFDHLVNHHELPPQLAIELAAGARERATIDLVQQAGLQNDMRRFAQHLNLQGRLTPSFLMRCLCLGHISFVEHALAELAGITHHRAWLMMHDAGPLGLKTLFERSGLPQRLYAPFRAGIDVYHQLEAEGFQGDLDRMRHRMIERVLTMFQNVPKDDLDYLLEKLDTTAGSAAMDASLAR
jgi:uncharacterized protein (DUF2336 family)